MAASTAPQRRTRRGHAARVVLRSAQIAWATGLSAAGFGRAWLRSPGPPRERAEAAAGFALRRLCERLGATFIKVGQIASTRADLLPPPVIAELARLRDDVPPFPFAAVRQILAEEVGRPVDEVFVELAPLPVAAASVAQVHRGVLREGGAVVAVKVCRPDIRERAELDRSVLLMASRLLERVVPTLRLVALEGAMQRFCDAVLEQIDLRNEAAHNARFTANFAEDPDVLFPRLHPELCGERVLVMEFVEGVHERQLEGSDVDVRQVVAAGMRGVCRMIFSHGFVHADLHPGNMRFLPPGRVVLLDLGLVGRLEDEDRLATARMLFAFATGDGRTVARILHEQSPHTATPDYAAYEDEMAAFVADVVRRGLGRLQLTLEIARIFDILRRHRVQSRSHMTLVNLALMTAEGLGKRLAPELSLADEALPYLAEAIGLAVPGAAPRVAPASGLV